MVSATRAAVSGLKIASRVVAAAASNIANARNGSRPEDVEIQPSDPGRKSGGGPESPESDGYRPLRVTQESLSGGGVRARYDAITPSHVLVVDPDDPLADADGVVARPNVSFATELLNMGLAKRAYQASLKVIETEDRMVGNLLDSPT